MVIEETRLNKYTEIYESLFGKINQCWAFIIKKISTFMQNIFYWPTTMVVWFRSARRPLSRPENNSNTVSNIIIKLH